MTDHSPCYEEIEIGRKASHSKTVTEADVILFAGISGDFNPLHMNEEFARTSRFKKRVVHGAFGGALISALIGTKLFGPGVVYVSQELNFKKPVFIGDTLTARGEILEKFEKKNGELKFVSVKTDIVNQQGDVVTWGKALVLVP